MCNCKSELKVMSQSSWLNLDTSIVRNVKQLC